jgi:AraC-like DNA-binding protein
MLPQPELLTVERIPALGGMDLVRARFQAYSSPFHMHPELEVGVVESGQRMVRCRGIQHRATVGSILVFAPGEVHAGAPLDGVGSSYRSFLIPPDVFPVPALRSPIIQDPELARQLVAIHEALEEGKRGDDLSGELQAAITTLVARHGAIGARDDGGGGHHRSVAAVRAYLETHLAERVRLDFLASIAGLSVFHLIRVFRAATGLTPYAYLEQLRVHRAAVLLREGVPIPVVAWRTGFSDQSHLTRMFKRLTGVPPGRYQQSALRAAS